MNPTRVTIIYLAELFDVHYIQRYTNTFIGFHVKIYHLPYKPLGTEIIFFFHTLNKHHLSCVSFIIRTLLSSNQCILISFSFNRNADSYNFVI